MIAMPRRAVAALLALVLAAPLPAMAQPWWVGDTDASLDDRAADAAVPLFGAPELFGTPTPQGGEPGAMLTDPVALVSSLAVDGLGMWGGNGRRGRGAGWYRQVARLSTFCPTCFDPANHLLRLDLLSDFTRPPDPQTQEQAEAL